MNHVLWRDSREVVCVGERRGFIPKDRLGSTPFEREVMFANRWGEESMVLDGELLDEAVSSLDPRVVEEAGGPTSYGQLLPLAVVLVLESHGVRGVDVVVEPVVKDGQVSQDAVSVKFAPRS